jgi:hypothetical protein
MHAMHGCGGGKGGELRRLLTVLRRVLTVLRRVLTVFRRLLRRGYAGRVEGGGRAHTPAAPRSAALAPGRRRRGTSSVAEGRRCACTPRRSSCRSSACATRPAPVTLAVSCTGRGPPRSSSLPELVVRSQPLLPHVERTAGELWKLTAEWRTTVMSCITRPRTAAGSASPRRRQGRSATRPFASVGRTWSDSSSGVSVSSGAPRAHSASGSWAPSLSGVSVRVDLRGSAWSRCGAQSRSSCTTFKRLHTATPCGDHTSASIEGVAVELRRGDKSRQFFDARLQGAPHDTANDASTYRPRRRTRSPRCSRKG